MVRGRSGVTTAPAHVTGDGPRAQAPSTSAVPKRAASERHETVSRAAGVIILSSVRGNGALGASSDSAQNATKPTHGSRCPISSQPSPAPLPIPSREIMPVPTPPEAAAAPNAITALLHAWGAGDARASDELARLVYAELRRQARRALRHEDKGHTLQPTALVHEAWLRLDDQHDASWESRTQFFAIAAQTMRRVLVDHARSRHAQKRGGARVQVTLSDLDRERPAPSDSASGEAVLEAID